MLLMIFYWESEGWGRNDLDGEPGYLGSNYNSAPRKEMLFKKSIQLYVCFHFKMRVSN